MNYDKGPSCPTPGGCDEAEQCWFLQSAPARAALSKQIYDEQQAAKNGGVPPVATPAPARPAVRPPSVASTPGAGSVTERIFAACDAAMADLRGSGTALAFAENGRLFIEARKRAIAVLEIQGVNGNSARKGSSMWLAARTK